MRSGEAVTVPVTPARSRPGPTARDGAADAVSGAVRAFISGLAVAA